MVGGRLFYIFALLGLLVLLAPQQGECQHRIRGFARTSGTRFVANGRPLYLNGFNAYWMMQMASDPSNRGKVSSTFQQASRSGMNMARTWAFSDGGSNALQLKPGSYNENMFRGLDFVISEAKRNGMYLILSLANNYENYGGKKQYVQWTRDQGQSINSEDDFYTHPLTRTFYKNHVKAVLTRINSITGVAYKDEPTIFAWELMNEPRCQSDLSGRAIQGWITEMAAHVKSIDANHLLEIGLEGFYGETMPEKKQSNPGYGVGTDFISNNQIAQIDFTTIHMYPDQWLPGSSEEAQAAFIQKWADAHIGDSAIVLRKPLLIAEFGKSSKNSGYTVAQRDRYFGNMYNTIYACARSGGPCGGGLFWQLMTQGMDGWKDGYEVIFDETPSILGVVAQQSQHLSTLG
ncbi:hypothetical protein GIB67_029299 [Kingdonia uniflora]|uniref:mannan endo-1,4-beta-mannosidase n=1 Tax=Kingdonia uniflora TaxID=39325 RepID=A0A7J7N8W1_9MAGN|nr:hypothetical protein GIB67_029299 [Kingdonia uniflora]